jgi:thioredoxin reductase/ferredoxin
MRLELDVLWYGLLLLPAVLVYVAVLRRKERRSLAQLRAAHDAQLHEPPTLHPIIDPLKCIGCGACVAACPEGDVLGLIQRKAILVAPSECIGHGACRAACPEGAIELVFGSETRGIELPNVAPDFQTNVPGLFIAGELGGMGLIRNAIEQGRQAVAEIAKRKSGGALDLAIVGAGPAGISASLAAREASLDYLTLEQETLGGTVAHYPRGKLVMSAPATLPLHGRLKLGDIGKEELLRFWNDIVETHRLNIHYGERVDGIEQDETGFLLRTNRREVRARYVLLTIGRRGSPRRLGVPGEDLPHVVYRLVEPEQYRGCRVVVVGGGNSAVEAALALSHEPGTQVSLIHRGESLTQANARNRSRVTEAVERGELEFLASAKLSQIRQDSVVIAQRNGETDHPCDAVIICTGGILPRELLKNAGVAFSTKFGTA